MKRTISLSAAVVLLGLALAAPAHAEEASCLVRVTFDPRNLPLNYDTVNALLNSRGGGRGAALEIDALRRLQQEDPAAFDFAFHIAFAPMSDAQKGETGILLGRLAVTLDTDGQLPDAQQYADQILKAACARLRADFAAVNEQDLARLRKELATAEDELRRSMQRHGELRAEYQALCETAGTFDLSRERIVARAGDLERERLDLEMRLLEQGAKRSAVAEQIAQLAKRVDAESGADPVAAELEKVVKLKEAELARMQTLADEGRAAQQELWGVQENIAKARADLAARRQAAADRAGGTQLQALDQMLMSITVDLAQFNARLQSVDAELKQMQERKLLERASQFEDELKTQMQLAEWQTRDTTQRCQELERRVRAFQPAEITILGGLEEASGKP